VIILVAAVVLLLVVGVAAVLVATGVAGARRDSGERLGVPVAVPVLGGVAFLVFLLLFPFAAILGLSDVRSNSGDPDGVAPSGAEREEAVEPTDGDPLPLAGAAATFDGRVRISVDGSSVRPLPSVGGLEAGDVVSVTGEGFLGHAGGAVAQCHRTGDPICRNLVPVLTDGEGRVQVPYRVEGPPSGDILVVEVDLQRGAARLAFGAVPADPRIAVSAAGRVSVRGAVAGSELAVLRCRTDAADLEACSTVGRVRVAADGTGSTIVEPRRDSMVTLVDAEGAVLVEPVRLSVPRRAAADVDLAPTQLVLGFGLALALLGVGIVLVRTTDWRAPAEAATPFLDAAPLLEP
jgi:hypothetical protein